MVRESQKNDDEQRMACGEPLIANRLSRPLWYVIQTKPQEEDMVRRRFEHAGLKIFYPRIRSAMRGSRSAATRIKAMFPSYLFAFVNLGDANLVHMIRYTRGVRRILGGDIPVPLPDAVIETIRERTDGGGVLEQQLVYKKGDRVRVRSGWLKDLVGILEKPVSAAGRVRVLLSIVDKCVRAELSSADIERLD